jgi:hypothetical protein
MSKTWSKMYTGLHVKYPLFFSDFNETWFFSTYFLITSKCKKFMKIRQLRADLFRADIQMDEQTWQSYQSLFAILRNRPKKQGEEKRSASTGYRTIISPSSSFFAWLSRNSSYQNYVASVILLGISHLQQVAHSNRFLRLEGKKHFHKKTKFVSAERCGRMTDV